MAKEVYINIKDLPEITEVSNGEYILVETSTGTHIVDFKNFVLPVDNTLITSVVSENTNSIISLSTEYSTVLSQLNSNTNTLSSDIQISNNVLSTQINSLSQKVNTFNNVYVGQCKITIATSTTTGVNRILPTPSTTLTVDDFIIYPANSYAANNPAYPLSFDTTTGNLTIKSDFIIKSLQFNDSNSDNINALSTVGQLSGTTIGNVLTALKYVETSGSATENAVYNVLVVKRI